MYSPWQRNWADHVNSNLQDYVSQQNGPLLANPDSAKSHPILKPMFDHEIPTEIEGFELEGGDEEAKTMQHIWPVGDGITESIMRRFTHNKMREAKFFEPPLEGEDEEEVDDPKKSSKIGKYQEGRNRVDWDGTSHISYVPPVARSRTLVVRRTDPILADFQRLLGCGVDLSPRADPDRLQARGQSRVASGS